MSTFYIDKGNGDFAMMIDSPKSDIEYLQTVDAPLVNGIKNIPNDGREDKIEYDGHCRHSAACQFYTFIGRDKEGPVYMELKIPVVMFSQDNDPYYAQYLKNWNEVEELIINLQEEATKAWGEKA